MRIELHDSEEIKMTRRVGITGIVSCIMVAFVTQLAPAAAISNGTYQLENHDDGNSNPPPYGMRLDELYNTTGGNDIFTFDFEGAGANMMMTVTNTTIHIFGTALGGEDTGASHAANNYLGLYDIDFTYNVGVQSLEPTDDDMAVIPPASGSNFGTLTPLNPLHPSFGVDVVLSDILMGVSFRLGDEDNDLGHRGHNGISGWGWLAVDGQPHVGTHDDFLFTAILIPEPATLGLLAFGLGAIALRRRR
jgi:hypothetical protein